MHTIGGTVMRGKSEPSPERWCDCPMAVIAYEDIEKYHEDHETRVEGFLDDLESIIIRARDKMYLPVYATKRRMKSISSLYLKTRRKSYASFDQVTDFGGLRILCMFEQDIFKVHEFLVQ